MTNTEEICHGGKQYVEAIGNQSANKAMIVIFKDIQARCS